MRKFLNDTNAHGWKFMQDLSNSVRRPERKEKEK